MYKFPFPKVRPTHADKVQTTFEYIGVTRIAQSQTSTIAELDCLETTGISHLLLVFSNNPTQISHLEGSLFEMKLFLEITGCHIEEFFQSNLLANY